MPFKYLTVERLDDGRIVRIRLDRPRTRNAQNRGLLVELDDALTAAEADDQLRVIILGGTGPAFSSGHDLGSSDDREERALGPGQHPTFSINGGSRKGAEARSLQEWHYYFKNTIRWRNLRKITIAEVKGPVYAAGLMLAWCCDLIVAAEDTTFADVVTTRLGMCGVEYFAHPWEFGPRRAKELLLTGDSLSAQEAYELGMVSKIYPNGELEESCLRFAERIATLPSIASLMVKESVNQAVDNMGFNNALHACFTIHELNHAHWAEVTGGQHIMGTPEYGLPDWASAPPVQPRDARL